MMLHTLFAKTLRDQRRSLMGWGFAVSCLVAVMAAIWPTIRDMEELATLMESYPEPLRAMFNVEDISSASGFLNAELYSIIFPVMFLIFAIGRGSRSIAGDEEDGLLEVVLCTSLSRRRVLAEKAAAVASSIVTLALVSLVVSMIAGQVMGMGLGVADHLAGAVALAVLGVFHGFVALAVGAASGRRSLAVAVASTVGAAGYVLYALGGFVDGLERWAVLSPFHQALSTGPVGGHVGVSFAWVLLASVVVIVASTGRFDHRDIAVG